MGNDLVKTVPKGIDLYPFGHNDLDITCETTISTKLNEIKPDYIINAAAYTAVVRAEKEHKQATLSKYHCRRLFICCCKKSVAAKFLHISTDFVFDGLQSSPYQPDTPANPFSIYGESKANGEALVRNIFCRRDLLFTYIMGLLYNGA